MKRESVKLQTCTRRSCEVLEELGIEVNPKEMVGNLSVGLSQMVEIAKAMEKEAKILVLDEPTASLSDAETTQLFKMMKDLQNKGVSMIYISHRMSEIMEIADSISILRDGKIVHTSRISDITMDEIIAHMMGENTGKKFDWIPRTYDKDGPDLLSVEHLQNKRQDIRHFFLFEKRRDSGICRFDGKRKDRDFGDFVWDQETGRGSRKAERQNDEDRKPHRGC